MFSRYTIIVTLRWLFPLYGSATEMASYAPERGPFIVNSWRAAQLGQTQQISDKAEMSDQLIDDHKAMER